MCQALIVGPVVWLDVVLLLLIPGGDAVWISARRARLRHHLVALAGLPFARIRAGTVRLAGILRGQAGRCYLEEISSGRRVCLDAGLSSLPPPGTAVTLVGEALDAIPDARADGYRSMRELWRVRPDEICRHGDTPVLPPDVAMPLKLRSLRAAAILLVTIGLVLGAGWPSYFNWCHCVWPPR
jgi:hypothetical protein